VFKRRETDMTNGKARIEDRLFDILSKPEITKIRQVARKREVPVREMVAKAFCKYLTRKLRLGWWKPTASRDTRGGNDGYEPSPGVGRDDPDTSVLAAEQMDVTGRTAAHRQLIVAALRRHDRKRGWTAAEIAPKCGLDAVKVSRRHKGLRDSGDAWWGDRRVCEVSGNRARPYWIVGSKYEPGMVNGKVEIEARIVRLLSKLTPAKVKEEAQRLKVPVERVVAKTVCDRLTEWLGKSWWKPAAS